LLPFLFPLWMFDVFFVHGESLTIPWPSCMCPQLLKTLPPLFELSDKLDSKKPEKGVKKSS
jgi:hypothetical protein